MLRSCIVRRVQVYQLINHLHKSQEITFLNYEPRFIQHTWITNMMFILRNTWCSSHMQFHIQVQCNKIIPWSTRKPSRWNSMNTTEWKCSRGLLLLHEIWLWTVITYLHNQMNSYVLSKDTNSISRLKAMTHIITQNQLQYTCF